MVALYALRTLSVRFSGPRLFGRVLQANSNTPFCTHVCMFGGSRKKKTMLAHNADEFDSLSVTCLGQNASHKHLPWGTAPRGLATSEETAYPMPLARAIANAFILARCNRGIRPLPSTMHDVQPLSLDALRTMRAQAGQQPKANKVPPIVPSFASYIDVAGHAPVLPQLLLQPRIQAHLTLE